MTTAVAPDDQDDHTAGGETPTQVLADASYCSEDSLAAINETGIDAFISTRKQKHGERPGRGPLRKWCQEILSP